LITSISQIYAIGDPKIGSWKILEVGKSMEEFLEVIPEKVRKKLSKT